ncbi:MAG: peptide deformylase [Desulfovibrionaceae bacterium]
MLLDILTYPDPTLAQKCRAVEAITPELAELAENMVETMYIKDGVGLAAPQVGRDERLIVLDRTGPKERKELYVLFNPEIVEREGETSYEEGCLSCPGLTAKTQRSERVTVTGLDREGQAVTVQAEGLLAIILQHEIDHLDGVTIVDHLSRLKRLMYEKKAKKWQKPPTDKKAM